MDLLEKRGWMKSSAGYTKLYPNGVAKLIEGKHGWQLFCAGHAKMCSTLCEAINAADAMEAKIRFYEKYSD